MTDSNHHDHEERLPDLDKAMPPIDFTTFILSLSTSVLVNLGIASPLPGTEHAVDLALARQTIDLLQLLHDKTRGNLSGEEERLLDRVLVDLRMKFVAAFEHNAVAHRR